MLSEQARGHRSLSEEMQTARVFATSGADTGYRTHPQAGHTSWEEEEEEEEINEVF